MVTTDFAAWNMLNRFEGAVVAVEIVPSHTVSEFFDLCEWTFLIFNDSMAENSIYDVFLRCFQV